MPISLPTKGCTGLKDNLLELVPGLEEQAWTIGEWGDQVLCGHNKGTFQIKGMQARLLSDVRGAMCMRQAQIGGEELLIQGTYTYLNIYRKNAAGEWYFSNSVRNFSHGKRTSKWILTATSGCSTCARGFTGCVSMKR